MLFCYLLGNFISAEINGSIPMNFKLSTKYFASENFFVYIYSI